VIPATAPPCPVCRKPLAPRTGPGRPPVTHPACRTAHKSASQRTRRHNTRAGWSPEFIKACQEAEAACEVAEGLAKLDEWTLLRPSTSERWKGAGPDDGPPLRAHRRGEDLDFTESVPDGWLSLNPKADETSRRLTGANDDPDYYDLGPGLRPVRVGCSADASVGDTLGRRDAPAERLRR